MSFSAAIVIASFILVLTAIAMSIFMASRRREAKEDELKSGASTRGWQFESISERGYRVHRWTGTTEGVAWRAESLRHTSGGHNRRNRRPDIARWHGDWIAGLNAPMVCMGVPKGKEIPSFSVAQGESFFAKLAQKAAGFAFDKAIDIYFGEALGQEVDAGDLRRVETKLPGFIIMAANHDEGARILAQGLERALTDASNDQTSVFGKDDRPWILLRSKGISLARMEPFRDASEVESFVHAGLGLTRAFIFGRRLPS
jgi:hypothetical protein